MRTFPIALPLVLTTLLAPPAHAEFLLEESYARPGPASTPNSWGSPPGARQNLVNRPFFPPPPPAIPLAQGFGDAVPLGFALRQIVPPRIRIALAPGIEPQLPVDWRGGRRWDLVLADAIAPLGLRLLPTPDGSWRLQP